MRAEFRTCVDCGTQKAFRNLQTVSRMGWLYWWPADAKGRPTKVQYACPKCAPHHDAELIRLNQRLSWFIGGPVTPKRLSQMTELLAEAKQKGYGRITPDGRRFEGKAT